MEMIQINTKKTFIPVRIGELDFKFDVSDNALLELGEKVKKVSEVMDETEGEDLESIKNALSKCFDLILGEGSFDAVYEQTPSATLCIEYLHLASEGIAEELKKLSPVNTDLSNEYIQKKNNK